MTTWLSSAILVAAGVLAIGGVSVAGYFLLAAEETPFSGFMAEYEAKIDGHTQFLLMDYRGTQIARLQVVLCAVLLGLAMVTRGMSLVGIAIGVAVVPGLWLARLHQARIVKLEEQLDVWLTLFANALKATPAIGEALQSTAGLAPKPSSEELDLVVKEHQLGTPIDRAVKNMSARIDSPVVSGALATIVIARHTGGNLPAILQNTADTLREGARLEGVLRTKTSEARVQLIVLALAPFVLIGALLAIDPTWFDPLKASSTGTLIIGGGLCAWAMAILWARQIMDVDI